MIDTLQRRLAPFLTARFMKFCLVGASGVGVNLGALAVLDASGVVTSVASAVAIQLSILSNFVVNEYWTFRDQRADSGHMLGRAGRFQLVSLVGGSVQWLVFILGNLAWLWLFDGGEALAEYFAGAEPVWRRYLLRPVIAPPEVGVGIYFSQLAGIGAATGWNYLANFKWTWGER